MLKTLAVVLLNLGGIATVGAAGSAYAIDHNAFYTCDPAARPAGAKPFEAGYAGHDTVFFPVAGVRCDWNAVDGRTFSTVVPDVWGTAAGWAAFVFPVAGVTALVLRTVRDNRRLDARSDSSS